jgi:hypothetical protein
LQEYKYISFFSTLLVLENNNKEISEKIHFRGANSIRRMDRIHAPLEKCRIEILN